MNSYFLFTEPSFLNGMGSVFNLWGNYYSFNASETAGEADARAIYSDWSMVGHDISTAINEILNEE